MHARPVILAVCFFTTVLAEDDIAFYQRQLKSGEQYYALQAVENAAQKHLYGVLYLAFWNVSGGVRVQAAIAMRQAPGPELGRVWRDYLLDDRQWNLDERQVAHDLTPITMMNIMMDSLRPYLSEIDPQQMTERKGRYALIQRISKEMLHETLVLPSVE